MRVRVRARVGGYGGRGYAAAHWCWLGEEARGEVWCSGEVEPHCDLLIVWWGLAVGRSAGAFGL